MLKPQDCYFDIVSGNWSDDGPNNLILISPKDIVDKENRLCDDEMNDLDQTLNAKGIYYLADSQYEAEEFEGTIQQMYTLMQSLGFTHDKRLGAF